MVAIPVVMSVILWGPSWLLALLVAPLVILGVREIYRLTPLAVGPLPLLLGSLWALALVLGALASNGLASFLAITGSIIASGCFVCLLWYIAFYTSGEYLKALLYLIGGPVYVSFLMAHGLALEDIGDSEALGRHWLLFALLVTFATDTGAFFVGRAVGRHAMAPGISPNKTWEGSVGGLVFGVTAALIIGLGLDLSLAKWQHGVIGVTVAVVAQLGDLFESKLKRIAEVKDSGSIIPGHGGVMDRLDSVVISIPAVYYLLVLVFKP
jgi:phosphatidate cytidylyltransferase